MRPFVADSDDLTEVIVDDAGRSTPAAVSKTLSISKREISRGRLARQARIIKIPLLVVAGEEDQIVDPQSVGVWAEGVERAEICLIDECGHMPMVERIAEFNAQILAFLTGDARYLDYAHPVAETKKGSKPTTPKVARRTRYPRPVGRYGGSQPAPHGARTRQRAEGGAQTRRKVSCQGPAPAATGDIP